MKILYADKPEDIDKWPSMAELFGYAEWQVEPFNRYDGSYPSMEDL